MHKKYYEYILTKLRFEKGLQAERDKETEEKRRFKLPRILSQDAIDNDHELFLSLNAYINNEEFLQQSKGVIGVNGGKSQSPNKIMSRNNANANYSLSPLHMNLSKFIKTYD
jgi:hypothetical protein